MNLIFRNCVAVLSVLLMLSTISCGTSGVIVALDVLEAACAEAPPIIQAFAGPLSPQYLALVQAADAAAVGCVTAQQSTTDSTATKNLTCATDFAPVVAQAAAITLAPGASTEITVIMGAVIAGIQLVVKLVGNGSTPTPTPAVKAKLDTLKSNAVALGSDKARVQDIMSKHTALHSKLAH